VRQVGKKGRGRKKVERERGDLKRGTGGGQKNLGLEKKKDRKRLLHQKKREREAK